MPFNPGGWEKMPESNTETKQNIKPINNIYRNEIEAGKADAGRREKVRLGNGKNKGERVKKEKKAKKAKKEEVSKIEGAFVFGGPTILKRKERMS